MTQEKLKVDSRVKRQSGQGCLGTVKEIRYETGSTATKIDPAEKERSAMIRVLWDNGTSSFFSPQGLKVVEG